MDKKQFANLLEGYAKEVATGAVKSDFVALSEIVEALLQAKERGATIFTVGNGGSAATASHICNDLLKGCGVCGRVGFKTECLCDSNAVMSCLANDFDYQSIFTIQLAAKAKEGDLLIAYSGSGNSPNVVNALKLAKEMGLVTIGLAGRDGGKMREFCDKIVIAPHDCMEMIEDFHMLYTHALSYTIQKALTEKYNNE